MADIDAPGVVPATAPGRAIVMESPGGAGPPFGIAFFASVLTDRVRAVCDGAPEQIPVVELHLADGFTADLCHIPVLTPAWMMALVYRDKATCKEMDTMFIPYSMVMRVTVSTWHRSQRPAGFLLSAPS